MSARYCPVCGEHLGNVRGAVYCSIDCATIGQPRGRHRSHATTTKQRGYDHEWRQLAKTILERDAHTCLMPIDEAGNYDPTSAILCAHYADTVDHIEEFDDLDDPRRLDPDNCRASCRRHNSQKSANNTNAKRREARA